MLCLLTFSAGAQEIDINSRLDWEASQIIFDLQTALPEEEMNPSHRYQAEQYIESKAPELITEELGQVYIDSLHTMADILYSDPLFYKKVEDSAASLNKTFSRSTSDMKFFTVRYTMPLYPNLVGLFPRNNEIISELDFFRPLDYRREDFTGIIIYARDEYIVHGENRTASLEPALFPRLLSPDLKVIYQGNMVREEALLQNGMVHYSINRGFDKNEMRQWVGNKPLQISARRIYGKLRTDIILSEEDCRLILANEADNQLLQEGKILILLSPSLQD